MLGSLVLAPVWLLADEAEPVYTAGWMPSIHAMEIYPAKFRVGPADDWYTPATQTDGLSWPGIQQRSFSATEFESSKDADDSAQFSAPTTDFIDQLESLTMREIGRTANGAVFIGVNREGLAGIYLRPRQHTLAADAFVRQSAPPHGNHADQDVTPE